MVTSFILNTVEAVPDSVVITSGALCVSEGTINPTDVPSSASFQLLTAEPANEMLFMKKKFRPNTRTESPALAFSFETAVIVGGGATILKVKVVDPLGVHTGWY